MINELKNVLSELELNAEENLSKEGRTWKMISDNTQVQYNTHGSRLAITIFQEYTSEFTINSVMFAIFKNTFVMIRNWDMDIRTKIGKANNVSIRNGIETEEEFFQQSTIEDFNGLSYEEYEIIQEIVQFITKHAWSL